ncbi:MAG: hypothetical protein ABSG96_01490 [Terracidiphilus sp.]
MRTQKDEFWSWFGENCDVIAADVGNQSLVRELDRMVLNLAPGLSWEIGPGLSKPWQFVISPSLDRGLQVIAKTVVASAPNLESWEFFSARQAKDWDYRIKFQRENDGGELAINAKNWTFVLLRYPDGFREILLKGRESSVLSEEDSRMACSVVLESILGEDALLDSVDQFELVAELESRFEEGERPIQELRAAVMGREF